MLRDISEGLVSNQQYQNACQWLLGADELLVRLCNGEHSPNRLQQLRLSILQTMLQIPKHAFGEDDENKVLEIIADVPSESYNEMPFLITILEAFDHGLDIDVSKYSDSLMRVIRKAHITERMFHTILFYLHRLRPIRPDLTCNGSTIFLCERLLDTGRVDWIEKVLVLLIWSYTCRKQLRAGEDTRIIDALDRVRKETGHSVSVSASRACRMVSLTVTISETKSVSEYNQVDLEIPRCGGS